MQRELDQMILEVGITDDPERVGFYSGLIESVFAIMSFLASKWCSSACRPFIKLRVYSYAVYSIIRRVWSKTYRPLRHIIPWHFCCLLWPESDFVANDRDKVYRRCGGGFMGVSVVHNSYVMPLMSLYRTMKIMLAELTDKSNQAAAFSMLVVGLCHSPWMTSIQYLCQVSYRLGQISGQPIGGYLSHPERLSSIFDVEFFRTYPFSLPCLVVAVVAVCTAAAGLFMLQEVGHVR